MSDRTSQLVERYIERVRMQSGQAQLGELANEILASVFEDDDLSALLPLFENEHTECRRTLVFVLSEVGLRSVEAMDWLDVLLADVDPYVKYYAVAAVQHSGSLDHPRVTGRAIDVIRDGPPVRLVALRFLALGSVRQLRTGVEFVDSTLRDALMCLLDGPRTSIGRFISDEDMGVASVGLAAAKRVKDEDAEYFKAALVDSRPELAQMAHWLDRFKPLPSEHRDILHRIARSRGSDSD